MKKVKFMINDSRILPEMSASVAFLQRPVTPEEQKPRTVINPAAIIKNGTKKRVFLVKEDRAVETSISTGEQLGDMIEVLSGIKAGDRVVLKPLNKMKDGVRVKEQE